MQHVVIIYLFQSRVEFLSVMFTSSFTYVVHDANRLLAIFLHGIFVVVLFHVIRVIILFYKITVDLMLGFPNLTPRSNVQPSTQPFYSLACFLQTSKNLWMVLSNCVSLGSSEFNRKSSRKISECNSLGNGPFILFMEKYIGMYITNHITRLLKYQWICF